MKPDNPHQSWSEATEKGLLLGMGFAMFFTPPMLMLAVWTAGDFLTVVAKVAFSSVLAAVWFVIGIWLAQEFVMGLLKARRKDSNGS